jgi:hypothetical protein
VRVIISALPATIISCSTTVGFKEKYTEVISAMVKEWFDKDIRLSSVEALTILSEVEGNPRIRTSSKIRQAFKKCSIKLTR